MRRNILAMLAVFAVGVLALAGVNNAWAQSLPSSDVSGVGYYDTRFSDNTLRLINPTTQPVSAGGFLCAMVYVFDAHEEMQECCGCRVTNDGLRVISVQKNLTANPLTGIVPTTGGVEVVSALPNVTGAAPGCKPWLSYSTTATIRGYVQHTNLVTPIGTAEVHLKDAHVGGAELSNLQSLCNFIHSNGTNHGLCTCGVGDEFASSPGAGGR